MVEKPFNQRVGRFRLHLQNFDEFPSQQLVALNLKLAPQKLAFFFSSFLLFFSSVLLFLFANYAVESTNIMAGLTQNS